MSPLLFLSDLDKHLFILRFQKSVHDPEKEKDIAEEAGENVLVAEKETTEIGVEIATTISLESGLEVENENTEIVLEKKRKTMQTSKQLCFSLRLFNHDKILFMRLVVRVAIATTKNVKDINEMEENANDVGILKEAGRGNENLKFIELPGTNILRRSYDIRAKVSSRVFLAKNFIFYFSYLTIFYSRKNTQT